MEKKETHKKSTGKNRELLGDSPVNGGSLVFRVATVAI